MGLASMPAAAVAATEAPTENALIASFRAEAQAYEHGKGVPRDGARAAALYCQAARFGDAASQFQLGWMYANGQGVPRSDATAAFFFNAAAEQGLAQAQRMLSTVGGPPLYIPECMQEPEPPKVIAAAHAPARAPITSARPEIRSNAPKYLLDLVTKVAPDYRVQPQLALSIMEAESNFDVVALSPRNAKGLMQLIPETQARFNVRSAYDPEQNIRGGLAYLRWLLAYYEGDVMLVAAAYNAGEGTVNRYRGVPPYAETRAYVLRILSALGAATHPFDSRVTEPSPLLRAIREARRSR